MAQTCGTCKHKGAVIEDHSRDWDEVRTTYFLCDLIKHINLYPARYEAGHGAGVQDGSGYHAALCVEDEFGCNKWEPKA